MAEIINLRRVRKQKAREERAEQAAENRILFGRTAAEKARDKAEKAKAIQHLDGHKRDT